MKKKKILSLLVPIVCLLITQTSFDFAEGSVDAVSSSTPPRQEYVPPAAPETVQTVKPVEKKTEEEFTLEMIKKYTGKNGTKMLVAVKDVVYDVTKVSAFKTGSYKNMKAGTDITKALAKLKNGQDLLKKAVRVGVLVAEKPALELTLKELSKFNGKNGQPAYIAVNGIIYDVSALPLWKNGTHQKTYEAGNDLSEAIKKSPHGTSTLKRAVIVGKLKK